MDAAHGLYGESQIKKRRKDMKKRRLTITAFLLCVVLAIGIGFATTTGSLVADGTITYHGSEAVTSAVYFSNKTDGDYSTVTLTASSAGAKTTTATVKSVFDTASTLTENKCTDVVYLAVTYDSGDGAENATLPNIKITPSIEETDPENRATIVIEPESAADPSNMPAGRTVNYKVSITFDPSNPSVMNGTYNCAYTITFAYELA